MKKRIIYSLIFFLAIIFFFSPVSLAFIGKLLIKSDPLSKADLIIVLAGDRGERVRYGASLYKKGFAKKLLFSGGPVVSFPGMKKITWAAMMKKYAKSLGIPGSAVILQEESRSTREDALFSWQAIQKSPPSSVILVTSPYHSKRAYYIFKQVFNNIEIHSAPVVESWFDTKSWWKSSRGRRQVTREYFAYMWFFIESVALSINNEAAKEPQPT